MSTIWLVCAAAMLPNAFLSCPGHRTSSSSPTGEALGTPSSPPASCGRIAATSGSDANAGTVGSPWRTAQYVADHLAPGKTGCFRAGTFAFDETIEITRPGITLTSYPGERATLKGELKIEKGADQVTISNLNIDGRSSYNIGPMVFAANTTFDNVDVTDYHSGICFILGATDPAYGRAVNTVIENSRIHDCGRLPPTNGDHGIYIAHSDGAIIRNNWIYDNPDRGIQLYPDSQGTRIYGNVIDGNGQGIVISGDGDTASSNNLIRNNVISNSKIRWNVESNWPGGLVGTGNVVRGNCLWATNPDGYYNRDGGIIVPFDRGPRGFAFSANVSANPQFVDPEGADFRMRTSSPCVPLLAELP